MYSFPYLGRACGMWKFLGQGANPSHISDRARSSTARPPGNSLAHVFLLKPLTGSLQRIPNRMTEIKAMDIFKLLASCQTAFGKGILTSVPQCLRAPDCLRFLIILRYSTREVIPMGMGCRLGPLRSHWKQSHEPELSPGYQCARLRVSISALRLRLSRARSA